MELGEAGQAGGEQQSFGGRRDSGSGEGGASISYKRVARFYEVVKYFTANGRK